MLLLADRLMSLRLWFWRSRFFALGVFGMSVSDALPRDRLGKRELEMVDFWAA